MESLFKKDEQVYVKCSDGRIRAGVVKEVIERHPHVSREIHGSKSNQSYYYYKVKFTKIDENDNFIDTLNKTLNTVEESKVKKSLEDFNS
jgi:hypothetical protein